MAGLKPKMRMRHRFAGFGPKEKTLPRPTANLCDSHSHVIWSRWILKRASFTRIQPDKYSSFHDAELDVMHANSLIGPWLSLGCDKLYDTTTCQLSLNIQANQYVPLEKRRPINEACIAWAQEISLFRLACFA